MLLLLLLSLAYSAQLLWEQNTQYANADCTGAVVSVHAVTDGVTLCSVASSCDGQGLKVDCLTSANTSIIPASFATITRYLSSNNCSGPAIDIFAGPSTGNCFVNANDGYRINCASGAAIIQYFQGQKTCAQQNPSTTNLAPATCGPYQPAGGSAVAICTTSSTTTTRPATAPLSIPLLAFAIFIGFFL